MIVDYKLIGKRIKTERKKQGLTQEKLAENLDVSIGYVSQVERGVTKISLDLLGEISDILNCDIAGFITESSVNGDGYMINELYNEISSLNSKKRKLLLDFIKILKES